MSAPEQTTDPRIGVTPTKCPDCDSLMDCASHPVDESLRPSPGDLSICLECTAFLVFADDMTLRLLTPVELRELPADSREELFRYRRAVHERARTKDA